VSVADLGVGGVGLVSGSVLGVFGVCAASTME
jgi:hypothetical protein